MSGVSWHAARPWRVVAAACVWSGCVSPTHGSESSDAAAVLVEVTRNPYERVDWMRDLWLKTALHDHVQTKPEALEAMDRAGYHAVPLMHYSGVHAKSRRSTRFARRCPGAPFPPSRTLARSRVSTSTFARSM